MNDPVDVRAVIADDHPLIRDGLASLLEDLGACRIVASVGLASECVAAYRDLRPDVVLLDIALPKRPPATASSSWMPGSDEEVLANALDTISQLQAINPSAVIVALSGQVEVSTISRVLDAGCRGFVHKLAPAPEVAEVVTEAVQLRDAPVEQKAYDRRTARALVEFLRQRNQAQRSTQLTPEEVSILERLRRGDTNEEIAEEMMVSRSTIGRMLRQIYKKLGAKSRTDAVAEAVRRGVLH